MLCSSIHPIEQTCSQYCLLKYFLIIRFTQVWREWVTEAQSWLALLAATTTSSSPGACSTSAVPFRWGCDFVKLWNVVHFNFPTSKFWMRGIPYSVQRCQNAARGGRRMFRNCSLLLNWVPTFFSSCSAGILRQSHVFSISATIFCLFTKSRIRGLAFLKMHLMLTPFIMKHKSIILTLTQKLKLFTHLFNGPTIIYFFLQVSQLCKTYSISRHLLPDASLIRSFDVKCVLNLNVRDRVQSAGLPILCNCILTFRQDAWTLRRCESNL